MQAQHFVVIVITLWLYTGWGACFKGLSLTILLFWSLDPKTIAIIVRSHKNWNKHSCQHSIDSAKSSQRNFATSHMMILYKLLKNLPNEVESLIEGQLQDWMRSLMDILFDHKDQAGIDLQINFLFSLMKERIISCEKKCVEQGSKPVSKQRLRISRCSEIHSFALRDVQHKNAEDKAFTLSDRGRSFGPSSSLLLEAYIIKNSSVRQFCHIMARKETTSWRI